jgi:hypothetical protein
MSADFLAPNSVAALSRKKSRRGAGIVAGAAAEVMAVIVVE